MLLKELCKKYGGNPATLAKKCLSGELAAEKINGRWDVMVGDYNTWKKRQRAPRQKKAKHEINANKKINNRQCKKCLFGMAINSNDWACNYLEITGRMRGCDTYPTCEKYTTRGIKLKDAAAKVLNYGEKEKAL